MSQSTSAEPSRPTDPSNEKVVSRPEQVDPASQDHLSAAKERLASRQADLDHHRQGVVAGIAKLNADLEKVAESDRNSGGKRLGIRGKIKVFQDQLDIIAEEQASLDRQKEELAREEQARRVEETAKRRQAIQAEGRAAADVIRHTLGLLEQQYSRWGELRNSERIAKDVLRSLAPHRMTELPDYSWATGIEDTFQLALASVIGEYRRSLADLYARTHAAEVQQQQEATRQHDQQAAEADRARREAMAKATA